MTVILSCFKTLKIFSSFGRQRGEKNLPIKRVETPKPSVKPPKSILKRGGRKDSKQKQLIFACPDTDKSTAKPTDDKVISSFSTVLIVMFCRNPDETNRGRSTSLTLWKLTRPQRRSTGLK